MDLKPISEALTTSPVDRAKQVWKDAIEKDWYFEGVYQKIFIVYCFLFTLFGMCYLVWRFFL